eukprot:Opistho-2@24100
MGQEGRQRRHDLAGLGIGREVGRRHRRGQAFGNRARRQFIDRQRHRILAEALLRDEGLGRVDQFAQILQPLGAVLVIAIELVEARDLEDLLDDLAQVQALGQIAGRVDQLGEALQIATRLARHGADALVEAAARGARRILQQLDRPRADAARREVHHTQEAGVVVRVLQQAQIGQRVLHLGAFEEAQAAIDAIGNAGIEQRRLDHPRLRIAAVEHGDFLAGDAAAVHGLGLLDQPLRLGEIAGGFVDAHRLAGAGIGAQVLAQALAVAADQLVGRVEDVAEAAVVLLQLDDVLDAVLALEVDHIADPGASEGVDALVVVAHRQHRLATARGGEHLQPGVLQLVGVLELVDQNVLETALVVLADGGVVAHPHVLCVDT